MEIWMVVLCMIVFGIIGSAISLLLSFTVGRAILFVLAILIGLYAVAASK